MSTVTLERTKDLVKEREDTQNTNDSVSREVVSPEERLKQQLLEHNIGRSIIYRTDEVRFYDSDYFDKIYVDKIGETFKGWEIIPRFSQRNATIWDTDKLKRLLSEPLGSPVDLTKEEAEEIVRLAAGRRPDLLPGKIMTRGVREQLGHSISKRLERSE